MHNGTVSKSLAACVLFLFVSDATGQDGPQTYGMWEVSCGTKANPRYCFITAKAENFWISFEKLKNQPYLDFTSFTKISCPAGADIKIDDAPVAHLPISICGALSNATMKLDDTTLQKLQIGRKITVVFTDMEGKSLIFDASLENFSQALGNATFD